MSSVIVKENETLDSALRRFKRNCAKAGIQQEIRRREHYEKPRVLFCRNDQDAVNHESKSEKNDKLLQPLPGSFCGRHVICDTFCGSGTDYSTGCAVCDIDSDLSAAPDDVAETFFDWHRIVCASGIGLLQPVFYRKLWTCDGGKDGI